MTIIILNMLQGSPPSLSLRRTGMVQVAMNPALSPSRPLALPHRAPCTAHRAPRTLHLSATVVPSPRDEGGPHRAPRTPHRYLYSGSKTAFLIWILSLPAELSRPNMKSFAIVNIKLLK